MWDGFPVKVFKKLPAQQIFLPPHPCLPYDSFFTVASFKRQQRFEHSDG
jgi:hypothetical protein